MAMNAGQALEALDGIIELVRMGAEGEVDLDPRALWMLHAALRETSTVLEEAVGSPE